MAMSAKKETLKQNKQREKEKIKYLMKNVEELWPNFSINEELLRNPTTNFVKTFYANFLSEFETLKNGIRTNILGQEVTSDQKNVSDEISLTIRLKQICAHLGMIFNLNDICEPQPKRTVLFFTLLLNVMIYLKSNTDYVAEVSKCVEKNEIYKDLKAKKISLLGEIEDSKVLDIQLECNISKLTSDIENLNKEYKEVLLQKTERDYKYQQDYKIINKIKDDIKVADECLGSLKEESLTLQEQIVKEEEVENLKKEIEILRNEYDKLDRDRINATSIKEEQEEKINYYKQCLVPLQSHIFVSENFEKLKTLQEQLKNLHETEDKVGKEIILKESELIDMHSENLSLHEKQKELQKELALLKNDTTEKIKESNYDIANLQSKIEADKIISTSLENEIMQLKENRSGIIENISTVQSTFKNRYEQFISHKNNVLDKFSGILKNIDKN